MRPGGPAGLGFDRRGLGEIVRRYRSLIIGALLAIAAVAGLIGWLLIREVSPQFIQSELEQRLSAALATSVTVQDIKVSSHRWIELEARGIHAWPSQEGSGLEIPHVVGSIDPLSLLFGKLRLRRLRFDEAVLRAGAVARSPEFARFAAADAAEPGIHHPSELLRPLIGLEIAVRYLLESPPLASALELRDARIELDPIDPFRSAPMELRELRGQLVHHRFSGESRLRLEGRLRQGERDLGAIALGAERSRSGRMRISLNLESLALGISDSYVSDLGSDARIDGSMSGEIVYETPEPGSGHLAIDLVCEQLRSAIPTAGGGPRERTDLPRVDLSASLVITPQSIAAHEVVISAPPTTLRMSGMVARPLQSASMAELSLEFDDVTVSQVRHLIGWLPEIKREEAAAVVAPLQSGRLVSLRASGGASLGGWQSFLAGRTRSMPEGFRLGAELADTVIRVGESDRIEQLSGRVEWIGSRAEAVGVTALLNDSPLPSLDLVVDGFPNFFAGDPASRQLVSGAEPLVGLGTLWRTLRPAPDGDSTDAGMSIALQLDYLDHPMFLWPIRNLQLAIETESRGLHVKEVRGSWAGVPIEGTIDWLFLPDERVHVAVSAGRPSDRPALPTPHDSWARGRFSVGPIAGERWQQSAASGEFSASADRVRIRKLAIDLEPTGVVDANARLHLSEVGAVPFQLSFDLKGGDAAAVANLFHLPPNQINGGVDLAGSFDGSLLPDTSIYAKLHGLLSVRASDGVIRKKAPPVAAISEASEALEKFDASEVIRYQNFEAVLEFDDGRIHTDAFSLEGPELGVLASGGVDLMSDDKWMDGKVALFLFPKLDNVLGKIPIVNLILLGTDSNLVATYFHVSGPWGNPEVEPILLPGSAGPTSVVLQGVPMFVKRGFKALGSLIRPDSADSEGSPPAESATQ